jgi:predicted amidohydrolase YtcJ
MRAASGVLAVTLAVTNAHVWTGNRARPWAEAIAVSGERIQAVGSNQEIRSLAKPSTRIIDAGGAIVTPGFIDAHIHLFSFDRSHPLPPIYLRFLRGRAAVAEKIRAYAAALPEGAWILGEDWTDATWGGPMPPRQWLDRLAPGHPVWLTDAGGTAGLANSAALRAAGLPPDTSAVPMWRIEAALIERSREDDDRLITRAMANLARVGVTSVQHNNAWTDFLILRRLHDAGKLQVRVYASTPLPAWERLRDYIAANGRGDSWLHWGGLKGYGVITADAFYPWISGASRAGLQVMAHVGDEADLRALLSVYDRVRREQALPDPRFRVEHAHDLPPGLIPLMASAGVIASWQPPLLAHYDQRTAAGFPPPRNLFPCRALLQTDVKIAFGTDVQAWVTEIIPPVASLQMALERAAPDGTRLTFDEAMRAFTLDAAWAEFAERDKGSLEPGKLADLVLFDRDFSRGPVHAIHDAGVRLTVAGGRVTFARID